METSVVIIADRLGPGLTLAQGGFVPSAHLGSQVGVDPSMKTGLVLVLPWRRVGSCHQHTWDHKLVWIHPCRKAWLWRPEPSLHKPHPSIPRLHNNSKCLMKNQLVSANVTWNPRVYLLLWILIKSAAHAAQVTILHWSYGNWCF